MKIFFPFRTLCLSRFFSAIVLSILLVANSSAYAQANHALHFDGADDYVRLPSILMGVTSCTFEAWLNYEDNGAWTRVLDFGTGPTVNLFLTPRNAENDAPRFAITTDGAANEDRLTGTAPLTAGRHHLAVTLRQDGSKVTGTLYVDGVVAATNPAMTLTPSSLGTLSQFYLGRSQYDVDPYLKGSLDEVRFYDMALTQAQVQADMNRTAGAVPATGLRAYYDFNQGIAAGDNPNETTLLDRSGNAHQGTLINFALTGSVSNWVGNAGALPVELVAFSARTTGRAVQLRWTTASEKNSARFEVERSNDGLVFIPLGSVAAQGTKATTTIYTYQDNETSFLSGTLYYRLRQIDRDTTTTYSSVRAVQVNRVQDLTCYPNPIEPGALAILRGGTPNQAVQVFDKLGRIVTTATADATGKATLTLPPGLSSGVYHVRTAVATLHVVVP